MNYKKITIFFKENPNAKEFDTSVYSVDYDGVTVTVTGDYLVLSVHGDALDSHDKVITEVHHLSTIKNWVTYMS
jgi:hypothetical protein